MKQIVKLLVVLVLAMVGINTASAQAKKKANEQTEQWRYEVELVGQRSTRGGQGLVHILKVWSFSKKNEVAEEQGKKNAIHAIVYKGCPGNDAKRLGEIPALLQDPTVEMTHAEFLKNFFAEGGDYMRFVSITNGGQAEVLKVGKEYKVGLTVLVDTPSLRKYFEAKKIIMPLNEGFDKAKKPSIMVVPSDVWCKDNGYLDENGVPNYRKAFAENSQLNFVMSKMGSMMSARGFDLRLLLDVLKTIETEDAENMMLTSNTSGAAIAEDPIDKLRRVAKADIILEVSWNLNVDGMKQSMTINIIGKDSYTNEQIAACQGTGQPTYSKEIPVLLEEAVGHNLGYLIEALNGKFNDWFTLGRNIAVQVMRWDSAEFNLESEFGGKELGEIIEEYISANTVNKQYTTDMATSNKMIFSNVRIPMVNQDGKAMDARMFGQGLRRMLRDKYQITSKVMTKGLGQTTIVLGEK